ncbi:hypothetical protein TrLO_g12588 [Triparma laevis f. longispina]|uniref:Uncharacterized protein n=1 Tax=Triparma laevis f. longispina TaxID=1714387 RepID=A0A9W6ZD71_9STRA|nr:hypothetical protein TrLO_g12588 [Triparma laevis f. longispina]
MCDHILKHHNSSTFLDTGAIKQEIVDGLTTALETSYDDFRVSPLILHFLQKILHLSSLETPHLQQANTDTHNTYHEWLCNFQKGEWSRKLVSFITNPSSSLSLKYHSAKTLLNVSETHPESVSTMGRDWYSILKNFEVVLENEGGFVPGGKEFDDDNEAPDDDENDDEGDPTPTLIDSVKNFTYPTSTPYSMNFPKNLPMVPFSSIRVDLENLLKTSKEAYNPKRAHEFLPSNYFPSNLPSFVWSSGLPIVSQIRELTKFYISNPEALLDPSFILNTDPTPNSLLPTALMYIIQSIPTSLSPHISATLTSKTSYISNLLTYLKTGLKTSPFLLPLTYDWSDVIEFRLKDVITQINDWKNPPTNGVEASVKSFEWSFDRANFLKIVCESTEEYCCGELVIGELYECTTSSNLSAVIILLSVFEVESSKCGANEVNVLFDKLNSKIELMIESRCER